MKYAGLIKNDFSAAPGVSVSFFTQGCPHRCPGCHNPETWDFAGGKEFTQDVLNEIIEALTANGINRSLAIQGGEPLCPQNEFLTLLVITNVKEKLPGTKIYIWTGFYYEDLLKNPSPHLQKILEQTNVLIDGPYVQSLRDITLPLRGSSNQSIINLTKNKNFDIIKEN
jgi:anaerobic ribonucleoside-triphosphate reductase activating protein